MTPQQQDCLRAIAFLTDEREGVAPGYREIAAYMGLASINGVHRLVTALIEQGRLRRRAGRNRNLEIVREVDLADVSSEALCAELHRRGELMARAA